LHESTNPRRLGNPASSNRCRNSVPRSNKAWSSLTSPLNNLFSFWGRRRVVERSQSQLSHTSRRNCLRTIARRGNIHIHISSLQHRTRRRVIVHIGILESIGCFLVNMIKNRAWDLRDALPPVHFAS
jgi:hypothetical protein